MDSSTRTPATTSITSDERRKLVEAPITVRYHCGKSYGGHGIARDESSTHRYLRLALLEQSQLCHLKDIYE
jgi:hypothetical protein